MKQSLPNPFNFETDEIFIHFFIGFCSIGLCQLDTITHTSFSNGLPNNWETFDSTGNDYFWQHTYTGLDAAYISSSQSYFNSSSSQDGWMMYNAGYFNTDTSGGNLAPIQPGIKLNATLTSDTMDFSAEPIVYLHVEHWFYTLSSPSWGNLDLRVTNDGVSWTTFDMHTGSDSPSSGWANGVEEYLLDISSIAAGQSQVQIQFHFNNLAWHFWNVDDVVFSRRDGSFANISSKSVSEMKLYPNPVRDIFTIQGVSPDHQIKIYNSIGQELYFEVNYPEDYSAQLNVQDLAPGMYTLVIASAKSEGKVSKLFQKL